jgi:thiol-disulfide isomerase/thioredoxin
LPFLTDLFSRYARATTYDLEFTEERQLTGEYVRNWSKGLSTAVVGPANQYRFEHHGEFGGALQVSDGKTEWIYSVGLNQYIQQPTPNNGPSKIHTSPSVGLERLVETRSIAHSISSLTKMIQSAKFAPQQDIQIDGKTIECFVIDTEGILPVSDAHITVAFTFWVEKQSGLIRKSVSRDHGELSPRNPGSQYNSETQRIYSVAALNPSSFPEGTFTFAPPTTAVLAKQFQDKQSQEVGKFVGKPLPTISVKDSSGKDVSLQSFQGKPLLLDFWATWCEPCRESLPDLEKLYGEYNKHLVLLSLDEDEEPQKAADFWVQNKVPWPNYHVDNFLPPNSLRTASLISSWSILPATSCIPKPAWTKPPSAQPLLPLVQRRLLNSPPVV